MVQHPDSDDLALFAVSSGSDLDQQAGIAAHVAGCVVCQAEIEAFRYIAELVNPDGSAVDATAFVAPGPHVWDAIADELGFDRGVTVAAPRLSAVPDAAPTALPVGDRTPETPAALGRTENGTATRIGTGTDGLTPPVDLASRRRSRWFTAAAALVVGAALGAGAMAITQRPGDPDPARIDATAALGPIPGGPIVATDPTLGSAELISVDTGQWVVVATEELPTIVGSYEVWLFGNDGKMIALGTLQAGKGQFSVPAGIDTTEYRTVDVSDEPADGNPAHSGISVARGTFS
ncbi:MAG: anti-sigma factor [Nakamurella sp.]